MAQQQLVQKLHFIICTVALTLALLIPINSLASINQSFFKDPVSKLELYVSNTKWDFFDPENIDDKNPQLKLIARPPVFNSTTPQAALTYRIDPGVWKNGKAYLDKWLKEYPKFGYELQMTKEVQFGALKGFEIELSSQISDRQIRQFIVHQPNEMWVFTCSSIKADFTKTWIACEKILQTARISIPQNTSPIH